MSNLALKLVASAAGIPDRTATFTGELAAYKYPRRIWFVDSLPTGPTGKLLRREVKPPTEEASSPW
jgi:long-chain acyl-CoA synthetase